MNFLYLLFFLDMLNLAVFIPVFSPFLRSLGGTPFTVGIINSSTAFVSLLWNPIVGSLSDQIGRKGLLIKCLIASAVGSLLIGSSNSVTVVFIGRLIGSLGSGVGILLRSIVADTYKTPEEKKSFFGKCAPVMSIAFLTGSVSSGFLSERQNGFSLVFFLMAIIMGIAAILVKNNLPKTTTPSKGKRKPKTSALTEGIRKIKKTLLDIWKVSWFRYKHLFIIKIAYDFAIVTITGNVGFILIDAFHLQRPYSMGRLFVMVSLIAIASNLIRLKTNNFIDKMTDNQIIIRGGLVLIFSFVGMAVSPKILFFVSFLALMCIPRAILDTKIMEMITSHTTDEDRGKVIGVFENIMPIVSFIVPALSGLLAQALTVKVLALAPVLPMTVAVITAKMYSKNKVH